MPLHHRWEIEATRDRALQMTESDRIDEVQAELTRDSHSVVLERVDVLVLLEAYRRRGQAIEQLARMATENADKAEDLRRSNGQLLAEDSHQRLSVNINDECAEILRRVKAERGISATEATRLALGLLGFFEEARKAADPSASSAST